MSSIIPTIGRKVWFWSSEGFVQETGHVPLDKRLPYDATIVFVNSFSGLVNLQVTTHEGELGFVAECQLRDPSDDDEHGNFEDYATWMPYQVGQAKKAGDSAREAVSEDKAARANAGY